MLSWRYSCWWLRSQRMGKARYICIFITGVTHRNCQSVDDNAGRLFIRHFDEIENAQQAIMRAASIAIIQQNKFRIIVSSVNSHRVTLDTHNPTASLNLFRNFTSRLNDLSTSRGGKSRPGNAIIYSQSINNSAPYPYLYKSVLVYRSRKNNNDTFTRLINYRGINGDKANTVPTANVVKLLLRSRGEPPDGVYFLFVTRDKAVTTPWPRAQFALKTLVSRVT